MSGPASGIWVSAISPISIRPRYALHWSTGKRTGQGGMTASSGQMADEIERLRGLALHDELTGLANRRAFLERLQDVFAVARAGGPSFTLTLLDLDGLK